MGLQSGDAPELWMLDNPDKIRALYQGAVDAGAGVIVMSHLGRPVEGQPAARPDGKMPRRRIDDAVEKLQLSGGANIAVGIGHGHDFGMKRPNPLELTRAHQGHDGVAHGHGKVGG